MPSSWNRLALAGVACLAGCGSPVAPVPADCPTSLLEPSGPWANAYGGARADGAVAIDATPAGDLVVAGRTRSFGAAGENAWVLKLGRGGDVLWAQRFDGPASASAISATHDGGAVLAADTSVGTAFARHGAMLLARLDCAGAVVWARTYEVPEGIAFVEAVRETADGGVLVAGEVASAAPGTDCLVFKTSADGTLEWQRAFGRPEADEACHSIALAAGGGALVAGEYEQLDSPRQRSDVWLLRLGPGGEVAWERTYGEPDVWERRPSVLEAGDGTFLVTALRDDGAALLALDASGATVWQRRYDAGRPRLHPADLWVSPDGAPTIVGTIGPDSALEDVWALRLSALGDPVWSRRYPRETLDQGVGVTGLADGRAFLTGTLAWGSPADADELSVLQPGADGRVGAWGEDAPVVATRMNVGPIDTAVPVRIPQITVSTAGLRATPTQVGVRAAP